MKAMCKPHMAFFVGVFEQLTLEAVKNKLQRVDSRTTQKEPSALSQLNLRMSRLGDSLG